ncbi:MAG: hypothetical protein IRY85_16615 [Micromonosporaceae bacterium]|nr:hypothetical protein [Micromonosporaceae bacterium]
MSSVVSFYRVQRSDLAEGELAELLTAAAEVGEDYGWSGYVMLNLLTAMEEADVVLGAGLTEEVEAGEEIGLVYLATADDIETLENLDLDDLDEESLGDGFDMDEAELREAMTESLTLLRELVAGTGPDEVLVISIA